MEEETKEFRKEETEEYLIEKGIITEREVRKKEVAKEREKLKKAFKENKALEFLYEKFAQPIGGYFKESPLKATGTIIYGFLLMYIIACAGQALLYDMSFCTMDKAPYEGRQILVANDYIQSINQEITEYNNRVSLNPMHVEKPPEPKIKCELNPKRWVEENTFIQGFIKVALKQK